MKPAVATDGWFLLLYFHFREADKLTLLRRVCFDLTGLPPLPELARSFLADNSPQAFAKIMDALLASPQFGERWGRHWLDVARYAESTGKDINLSFPNAWRYRDYVIAAFNANKPYEQFLNEHASAICFWRRMTRSGPSNSSPPAKYLL